MPHVAVSSRPEARIRNDFAPAEAEAVLARLAGLKLALAEKQSLERIQAAVVVSARGDADRFERTAALAETDWRYALVAGGLANEDWRARLDEELRTR
jgi:hypothetical protein